VGAPADSSLRHRRFTRITTSFSPQPSPDASDLDLEDGRMEFRRAPLRPKTKKVFLYAFLAMFLAWFFMCKLTNYGVLVSDY
jgi:hypothetical protein